MTGHLTRIQIFLSYGAKVFAKVTLTNCSSGALLLSTRARTRAPSQPFRTNAASVLAGRSLKICPSACASAMTFAIIADQVENPLETRARIISFCSESNVKSEDDFKANGGKGDPPKCKDTNCNDTLDS